MARKLRFGLAGGMFVLLATTALPALAVTDADLLADATSTDNVLMNGMGYPAQRFSPLAEINKDTVKKLVPAWTLSFGGEKQRGQESQPLIHNGKMFVTASYSRIFALDTKTAEANKQTETKQAEAKKAEPKKVMVQAGDSLSSIADANGTTWVRLFNKNDQITNPDVIDAGMELTVPTADEELTDRYSEYVASQPAPAVANVVATTATTYTTRNYSSAPVNSSSYYVGNGMWCTDYVHSRRPDVAIYGNAGYNWIGAAQAAGKSTGSTPKAGAVAVTNGHVAYVESVNADGSYVVSEMGWNYQAGNYNKRTVSPGTFGQFIY